MVKARTGYAMLLEKKDGNLINDMAALLLRVQRNVDVENVIEIGDEGD